MGQGMGRCEITHYWGRPQGLAAFIKGADHRITAYDVESFTSEQEAVGGMDSRDDGNGIPIIKIEAVVI